VRETCGRRAVRPRGGRSLLIKFSLIFDFQQQRHSTQHTHTRTRTHTHTDTQSNILERIQMNNPIPSFRVISQVSSLRGGRSCCWRRRGAQMKQVIFCLRRRYLPWQVALHWYLCVCCVLCVLCVCVCTGDLRHTGTAEDLDSAQGPR
jgi:hypothetical protein